MRRVWASAPDNSGNPSADGRLLSFVDWETGDVAVRDLISGQERRITQKKSWMESPEYAEWPKISPDGKRVIYSWVARDYGHELRIVDVDPASKTPPRIVLRNPDLHYIIPWAWAPDGKSVVTLLSRGDDTNLLAWVGIADGSVRPLKSIEWLSPSNVSVSVDGRFLVYDLNQGDNQTERDIFILAADGSGESRLVQHPGDDYAPIWAPGGRSLLFLSNRTGAVGFWSVPVSDGQATGPPAFIKGDLGRIMPLGITRDGSLLYAEHRGMDDIFSAELNRTNGKLQGAPAPLIERFMGRNSAPVWSPDGKYLAYYSNRDQARAYGVGTSEIVVRSMDTGNERVFSGTRLALRQAIRWMPDGQSILIVAKETDTRQRAVFCILNLASGKMRTVARANLTLPFPAVLPGGKSFLVAGGDQGSGAGIIMKYDVTTGEAREVYRAPRNWVLRNLAISPDGEQLVFSVADPSISRNVIYILPAAGGQPHSVLQMEEPIAREGLAWSADGRYLLFVKSAATDRNELFRVPVSGGAPESTNLAAKGLSLISPHPDGARIAYTVGQYLRVDVWAMEHFLSVSK